MKILHLTLHKKWFDLIAEGIKTKEFRDIKPYWTSRLDGKEYDEIHIRNGYSKDSPFMRIEWKGCDRFGKEYMIHLGKILELKNV